MKDLARTALQLARHFTPNDTWDAIRDRLDHLTGGGLDAFELDLLTDAVRRLVQR